MFETQLLIWSNREWGWVNRRDRVLGRFLANHKFTGNGQSLESSEKGNDKMKLECYPIDVLCDRLERKEKSNRKLLPE